MARAFVQDLWLVKHDAEGRPTPSAVKRTLASARDPLGAKIPEKWKTERFGRGRRWRVSWTVVNADGKRVLKSKAFEKFSDADAYRAALEDDLRAGRYVAPVDPHTFAEASEQWLRMHAPTVKEATIFRYRTDLDRYLLPNIGETPLQAVTAASAQDLIVSLRNGTAKGVSESGLSKSVAGTCQTIARGVFAWAIKAGWRTGDNPFKETPTLRKSKAESSEDKVYLTPAQVEALAIAAEHAKGHRTDGNLVRFLALTGCRIGEATALQLKDVNMGTRRASITKTWTVDAKGKKVLGTPKSGKPRKIALPPELDSVLVEEMRGKSSEDWLFSAPLGGPIRTTMWRVRVFNPAVKEAGFEQHVTPHSLRHTYASWAIASHADIKTVQTQLGHATAAMTLDAYAALWPDRLDEVSTAVGKMFEAGKVADAKTGENCKQPIPSHTQKESPSTTGGQETAK